MLAADTKATCPFAVLEKEYSLKIPGKTIIPGGEMAASLVTPGIAQVEYLGANDFTAYFDYEKTGGDLKVRCRNGGDRFQPLGLKNPKRLNVFMIDARIPRDWRERIPIVSAPGQIIWVTGWRIGERVKVTDKTRQVLRLEYKRPRFHGPRP